MSKEADFVVAYDITDDKERDKIANVLKDFGFRVQKSVFECKLRKGELEKMVRKIEELNLKTGFAIVYRIQKNSKKRIIGSAPKNIDDDVLYLV